MKYPVYCIRDTKVGFDTQFIVQANEGAAKRAFAYMMNNPGSVLNFQPTDFQLFKVAEFDTESGNMEPILPAEFVIDGVSVFDEK